MTAGRAVTQGKGLWNGVYDSWAEACDAAASGPSFESERWLQRITGQLLSYRADREAHGIALPPRPCNLPLVCALTRARSVVDFGGSSGWAFEYVRDSLARPSTLESYVIVEIPRVVEHMQKAALHPPMLRYATGSDELPLADVFYSNSALQYCESNAEMIDVIARTQPRCILLEDLLATAPEDFFSTQTYYDGAIPTRFVALEKLKRDLATHGYSCLQVAPFPTPIKGELAPLPMENFPLGLQVRHSVSAVFFYAG